MRFFAAEMAGTWLFLAGLSSHIKKYPQKSSSTNVTNRNTNIEKVKKN